MAPEEAREDQASYAQSQAIDTVCQSILGGACLRPCASFGDGKRLSRHCGGQGSQSFCRSRQLIGGPLVGLLDGSSHSASLRRPVPALSPHDRGGNGQILRLAVVLEMRPDWTEFLLWDAAWLAFKYYGSPFNLVPRPSDSSPSSRSARLHHTLFRLRDSESTEPHAGAGPSPTPPR